MKKSALKEYIREEIIKTLSEMDAYQVTGKTGKKTVASFQSQGEANKFKQQNPNIVSVEKLEEKKEEEDVEVKDDYHKVDDEDGDKDKEPSKSELKKQIQYDTLRIPEEPKTKFYYGLNFSANREDFVNSLGVGMMMKTKTDKIYRIDLGLNNRVFDGNVGKLAPYLGGGVYWKIGSKNNRF